MENEAKYEKLKNLILGEESQDEGSSDTEVELDDDEEQMEITDKTDIDLSNLRRSVYLTIMTTISFTDAVHKLLKIKLKPGQEVGDTVLHKITLPYLIEHNLPFVGLA